MVLKKSQYKTIIEKLVGGAVGIIPTDTIYGIHCSALNDALIRRIYEIKNRPEKMPMITLLADVSELNLFNVKLGLFEKEVIKTYWPGPNTLIFSKKSGETISFRLPNNPFLIKILNKTGPLISTSANLHATDYLKDVNACVEVFTNKVDFFVDGGVLNNPPSSIYKIENGSLTKIR